MSVMDDEILVVVAALILEFFREIVADVVRGLFVPVPCWRALHRKKQRHYKRCSSRTGAG